jgi:flagellar P-ring protein precursor FlgI
MMKIRIGISAVMVALLLSALFLAALPSEAQSATRIKNLAFIRGVRSNQLVGYGLVAGLDGTGDGRRVPFTGQMLANMVNQFGISFETRQLRADNIAAVTVTAELPPYAKEGSRIDVTVSTIGDSESLQGGTLLLTPLQGVDGKVYALAQGAVSIGGFKSRFDRRRGQEKHLTTGIVGGGALVEKEVPSNIYSKDDTITLQLNQPDFTTASRVADAINLNFHQTCASAVDGGSIAVNIPLKYRTDKVAFISEMESVPVETDIISKVIINERTGTVVTGKDAVIAPVTVSHGDIHIIIGGAPKASNGADSPRGLIEKQDVEIDGANVGEVAAALGDLGVKPQDLVAIFQAIDRSGALQVQLELM